DGVELSLVVRELKERFLPRLDVDAVASIVAEYLKKLDAPWPPIEMLAIGIARHLLLQPKFDRRDLEAVIKNRPAEFADAVERSDWDESWRIAEQVEKMNKQNPPVPFYKKIQPAAGKKASTKRYERTRRYHPLSIGLIERQFGESHGRGLLLPDFELS